MIGRLQIQNKGGAAGIIDLLSNQSTVMAFGGGQRIALKGHRAKEIPHKVRHGHEKTKELTLGR